MKVLVALFFCAAVMNGVSAFKCGIPTSSQLLLCSTSARYLVVAYNKNFPICGVTTVGFCGAFNFNLTGGRFLYDVGAGPTYTVAEKSFLYSWSIPFIKFCDTQYYVAYYENNYLFLRGCGAAADGSYPFIVLKICPLNAMDVTSGTSSSFTTVATAIKQFLDANTASAQYVPVVNNCAPVWTAP